MDTHLTLKHPTIKTTIPKLNPDNYLSASSPKRPHPNSAQNSKRLSCEIPVGFEKDARSLSGALRPSGSSVYPIKNSTFKEAQAARSIKPVNPRKILAEKVEIIQVRPKAQGIEASPWEMPSEIWQENILHDNTKSHKNSQHGSPVIEQGTAINLPEIPENPRISVASLDNLVETEVQSTTGRQAQNSLNSQQLTLLSRQSQVAFVVPQRLNHQASISDSENNNVTDSQDQNTINNIDQLFLIESGIHKSYTSKIRGLFCLFFTIFVGTWLIAEMINGTMSTRAIFIVAYVGLGYFALECIYRVPLKHGQRWQNAEELFKAFDVMSLITFLLILDISLSTGIHIVKAGVIPSLVFTICYYFSTNAPQNIKGPNTVARFLFTVQLLLIAVRIDEDIDWSWKIVLCFFWLAFGIVSFYLLLLGLIFMGMMVLFCYRRRIYENIDRATQFYGHIWNLLYVGLGVIFCGTFLTAAIVADDEDSFEPVVICVEVTRYLALSLLIYTIVFSKYVTPFLRAINSENEVSAADLVAVNTEKRLISIEVEKQIVNLVKLSSTYFLSLKDSFTIKDKAHIMQLKKSMRVSKEEKFKNKYIRKETDKNKQLASRKPISIEEFKKDQEHLEEKLKNLTRQNSVAATLLKKKTVEDMSLCLAQHKDKEGENQTDFSTIIKNGKVICFSDGDLEKCDQFQNENETEGNTCYICVQNPCNAVMMNCGHGGVCYECALEFVKKKFECMQCRQKVERVVKINPDPRLGNIIKGYESIKLIFG